MIIGLFLPFLQIAGAIAGATVFLFFFPLSFQQSNRLEWIGFRIEDLLSISHQQQHRSDGQRARHQRIHHAGHQVIQTVTIDQPKHVHH